MIETQTARIWLGGDGIIRAVLLGILSEGVAIAQENWDAVTQVSQGKIRPVFADIRNIKSIGGEERRFYARLETKGFISAVAMLVDSPLSRVIGSFFLGLNKLPVPINIFTSEEQALAWLRNFLERGKGK
jgi:hypothetical protein